MFPPTKITHSAPGGIPHPLPFWMSADCFLGPPRRYNSLSMAPVSVGGASFARAVVLAKRAFLSTSRLALNTVPSRAG
jgi:hypothetical protein